eukprot:3592631-Prymnesium_polylepis.2
MSNSHLVNLTTVVDSLCDRRCRLYASARSARQWQHRERGAHGCAQLLPHRHDLHHGRALQLFVRSLHDRVAACAL